MVKKNFTREDLSNKIYKNLGFSKNFSGKLIDNFFETILLQIIRNSKIKISNFGTFSTLSKNERIGRNPKTKEETKILSRKVVKFKPSLFIKKKINRHE